MRIYCAGPIFSYADRTWLRRLGARLRDEGHDAFVPAEVEEDLHEITTKPKAAQRRAVFQANLRKLAASQLVVARLDGADADSGTSWEVGFAFARRIPVLGYRSDYRTLGREGTVNLMVEMGCASLVWAPAATEDAMLDRLAEALADPLFPTGGKLVRDGIPAVVEAQGRTPMTRRVRGEALDTMLRDKIVEEAGELVAAFEEEEVVQELVDLQEATEALAAHLGLDKRMAEAREERAEKLGRFTKGVVLEGLDAREA